MRLLLMLSLLLCLIVPAYAASEPEIVAARAGFAGCYKVGLWAPLEVAVRGGSQRFTGRVRARLSDSDGLNCMFEAAEPCDLLPGQEKNVLLDVRFGHESSALTVELLDSATDSATPVVSKTFVSSPSPAPGQISDALRPGRRLAVCVGASPHGMDDALPGSEGKSPRNVVAAVDRVADLPGRSQGYEGVDFVIVSTSVPEAWQGIEPSDARIEALDQWVRMGGTLVLSAGEHADEALRSTSPLARFLPGRYETTRHLHQGQTSGWETLAKSQNQIAPARIDEKLDLPIAKLIDVQGLVEAHEQDIPLVVRKSHGLGVVIFVAADLDRAPISTWSDRSLLLGAILGLDANASPAEASDAGEHYGFDDLAGQLRSSLEVFQGVHLVPFFVVATLLVIYILLIAPGDYFFLRRLPGGMRWTWITFPAVVVLFAAGAYWSSSWLKGSAIRVNQVDLVDIDEDGTARGASWFSIFSPHGETFDLSLQGRLPNGSPPQAASDLASVASLGWFGKAGDGFNGMYGRDAENASPLWSQVYSTNFSLDAIRDVPVQVASCKNFVYRWLGRVDDQGVNISLHEENRQPTGTITNNLKRNIDGASKGVPLEHAYLAYDGWAYALGTLRPGESVEVGSATRRVSLRTFMSSESFEDSEGGSGQPDKTPYDQGSRDAAYVLRAMLFFDMAGGRRHTGLTNDYQRFTDLSSLLRAGRAVLVAMPPQEAAYRGADLLRGLVPQLGEADTRQPLAGPADRHTVIYRFAVPIAKAR